MQDTLQRAKGSASSPDDPETLTAVDSACRSISVSVFTGRASVAARLVRLLADASRMDVVAVAAPGDAGCGLPILSPTVLVLDCDALDPHERSRLQRTARTHFPARVLWLTDVCPSSSNAVHFLLDAVKSGWCHGYIASDCPFDILVRAITAVARQDYWLPRALLVRALCECQTFRAPVPAWHERYRVSSQLTVREIQVLELVQGGLTNKEIGRNLGIEEDTVKKHLRNMYAKLGVHRRAQMLLRSSAGKQVWE